MNRATRIVASSFGAFAAIGTIEHGIFEIMQGDVAPAGVQFVVGHFFNDFLLQNGALILVLIPLLLVVTVLSAFAWDVQRMLAADDGDRYPHQRSN